MMQGGNRFLDFANEIMGRHRGLGFGFEPAAMLHLEEQQTGPAEQAIPQQNFTTNLYHIQNITEENYLFKQNLNFLTQILENKMYQNLYPSVEKQIEKVIREEMPQAETKIINSVSQELYRLVQKGGIEQFEIIREKILFEQSVKEKTTLKEQEKLFRKIENIWNSSVYHHAVQNHNMTKQDIYRNVQNNLMVIRDNSKTNQSQYMNQIDFNPQNYQSQQLAVQQNNLYQNQTVQQNQQIYPAEIVHPEIVNVQESGTFHQEHIVQNKETEFKTTEHKITEHPVAEQKESVLERTLKLVEIQNQILTDEKNLRVGNLGKAYEKNNQEIPLAEKIIESHTREINKEISKENTLLQRTESVPLEHVQEQVEVQKWTELFTKESFLTNNLLQKQIDPTISVRQENIQLEYPSEETTQLQQEIIQMVQSEIQRIPEVPKFIRDKQTAEAAVTEHQSVTATMEHLSDIITTEHQRARMIEKSKTISEQILSRMEHVGVLPASQVKTAEKTVVLNKLSHAIMEYADSKASSEELQTNMVRILENYQTELLRVPGTDSTRIIYNHNAEVFSVENIKHRVNHRLVHSIKNQKNTPKLIQAMEPAAIVYRSEEAVMPQAEEKTKQLEKQVNEVVKTIKNVEQKTIVQKEQIIEQQKKVVHEVLKSNPKIWTEGESGNYIRTEVQQSVEEQINQSVNQIANRVYRRLEDKLKSERGRRGLI